MVNKILGLLGIGAEERIQRAYQSGSIHAFRVHEKRGTTIAIIGTLQGQRTDEASCVSVWLDGEAQMLGDKDIGQGICMDWPGGIGKVHGSFALAAWNDEKKELMLARDPMGSHPLFYAAVKEGIAFGSNLFDVVRLAELDRALNPEGLSDYLTYLYIPFPKTIIQHAFKVAPGYYVLWRDGKISIHKYFDFDLTMRPLGEAQAIYELERAIDMAVERMCTGDSVGVFLSGGLDSTTVLAFADRHARKPIPTFSLGFRDAPLYDECSRASLVAEHFKTKHHQIELAADSISAILELVKHYDEPFGNATSLLIYELAREARKHVSVVLTGDGGDEFFAGYPRLAGIRMSLSYRRLPKWLRRYAIDPFVLSLPESLHGRHWLRRAREFVAGSQLPLDEMYVRWITYFNERIKCKLLDPEILSQLRGYDARSCILDVMKKYPDNIILGAYYADLALFLPCNGVEYVSKSTRAQDLTVRSPLLDRQVMSLVTGLPMELKLDARQPKYLLRQLAKRMLPPQVLRWPKIGFNSPLGVWLQQEPGRSMIRDFLAPGSIKRRGLLRPSAVDALVAEFFKGRRDISLEVWALMFLEAWCRWHLD